MKKELSAAVPSPFTMSLAISPSLSGLQQGYDLPK